ncbi:MAG: carbohydrate ABC transporter permease [Candidatus Poribacteria bacterium]|nr:carbohydrate ABC transporter permease [Candidatus Poribacteria bacterium]
MRNRKRFGHYLILAFVAVAVIIYITPIYWILATSLKGFADITTKLPKFVFEVSLENYQKLMPSEGVPDVTYIFLAEVFVGLLLFGFFSLFKGTLPRVLSLRNLGLIWNTVFVLTCLYSFLTLSPLQTRLQTDARFNFLLLIIGTVIAYLLIAPFKKTNGITSQTIKKQRLVFVLPSVFGTIAICVALANGGSKYFYQLLNSIIIGGGSTILAVGLGTLAAYAFSRFDIAGKDDLLFFILSTRMLPPVVVVIPIYLMYSALGLRDTHFGLILLYTTFNVSFAVWLMKGFIDEIPKEYEDAALVDGYSRFQTFLKVILPQSVTGIAATAVFCLITAWNEFAFALVLTEVGGRAVTAPPSITSATGSSGMDWGKIAAGTFVFLLPVAVFTFLMRSHLLRGVTFGAVKK